VHTPNSAKPKQIVNKWLTGADRIQKGESRNPAGRPRDARNRAALLAENMFAGESEAIIRVAIALERHAGLDQPVPRPVEWKRPDDIQFLTRAPANLLLFTSGEGPPTRTCRGGRRKSGGRRGLCSDQSIAQWKDEACSTRLHMQRGAHDGHFVGIMGRINQ
jgi:hypothetical protein